MAPKLKNQSREELIARVKELEAERDGLRVVIDRLASPSSNTALPPSTAVRSVLSIVTEGQRLLEKLTNGGKL